MAASKTGSRRPDRRRGRLQQSRESAAGLAIQCTFDHSCIWFALDPGSTTTLIRNTKTEGLGTCSLGPHVATAVISLIKIPRSFGFGLAFPHAQYSAAYCCMFMSVAFVSTSSSIFVSSQAHSRLHFRRGTFAGMQALKRTAKCRVQPQIPGLQHHPPRRRYQMSYLHRCAFVEFLCPSHLCAANPAGPCNGELKHKLIQPCKCNSNNYSSTRNGKGNCSPTLTVL